VQTVQRLLEENRTVQWLAEILLGRPPRGEPMHSPRGDAVYATAIKDLNVGRTRKTLSGTLRLVQ
jgi:hypothetical protein